MKWEAIKIEGDGDDDDDDVCVRYKLNIWMP